jgi:hypothetical protein
MRHLIAFTCPVAVVWVTSSEHNTGVADSIVYVQRGEPRTDCSLYKVPTLNILQFLSSSPLTSFLSPQPQSRLTNLKSTCRLRITKQLQALKAMSVASAPRSSATSVLPSLSTTVATSSASAVSKPG